LNRRFDDSESMQAGMVTMSDLEDIRRILDADRQWELRQRAARRARARDWALWGMAGLIAAVMAVIVASAGHL